MIPQIRGRKHDSICYGFIKTEKISRQKQFDTSKTISGRFDLKVDSLLLVLSPPGGLIGQSEEAVADM